jgi:hypothetical protein
MSDEWDWFDTLPSSVQEEMVATDHELNRLRAEVDDLRAQLAAFRPIAEAVANVPVYATDGERYWGCIFCDAWHKGGWLTDEEAKGWPVRQFIQHVADCPVTQARALLAKESRDAASND